MPQVKILYSEVQRRFPEEVEAVISQLRDSRSLYKDTSPSEITWRIIWDDHSSVLEIMVGYATYSTTLEKIPADIKICYKIYKREDGMLACQFCRHGLDISRKALHFPNHNWLLTDANLCEFCDAVAYQNRLDLYKLIKSKEDISVKYIDSLYNFIKYPLDPNLNLKYFFVDYLEGVHDLDNGYYIQAVYEGDPKDKNPIGFFRVTKELADIWSERYCQ